jgi:aspartyl aminopeptidase
MIWGYGHADRSCAYPSLRALLALDEAPERTAITLLADKEEIGSVGATGMQSHFFENVMAELMALTGHGDGTLALRRCLINSDMLSNDVSVGYDPAFASAFEPKNTAYLGHGLSFNKFTGARGKRGSNDADAEYVARIRACMDAHGVNWQTAEIGKVDQGGGGTIAYMLAKYGIRVIDCGVPVLSMHAPWEVCSKADLYEAYRGYKAFLTLA